MKILIKPSEIIERFIQDKYEHFCLSDLSHSVKQKLVQENKEFELSEEDAFVIGFTNVIYTDELLYKFKQYIKEILENKKFDYEKKYYINKDFILNSVYDFKKKIPNYYIINDVVFANNWKNLSLVFEKFLKAINELPFLVIEEFQKMEVITPLSVKKVLNKL